MKLILVLAILFGSAHSQVSNVFSTRVEGTFLCHGEPYPDMPIELVHSFSLMTYPYFLERFTKKDGSFDLSAYIETSDYVLQGFMVIRHRCWQKKGVPHRCQRKAVWPIPLANVTNDRTPDPSKTFHLGTIDLKNVDPKNDVKAYCGVGK